MNYGDTSPSARKRLETFVEESFKIVEYLLILGLLFFLAKASGEWPLMVITTVLGCAFLVHTFSAKISFDFFAFDEVKNKWLRRFLILLNVIITLSIYYVILNAVDDVLTLMTDGIGV